MGKKGHGRSAGKGKVPPKDVTDTSANCKLSRQKRNDLNQIIDKLLKVSINFQTVPNAAKEWERHLEIRKLLEQVDQIEQGMKVTGEAEGIRATRLDALLEWMLEHGAEVGSVKPAVFQGYGWGLRAERDLTEGELVVAVPRRLMLTSEHVQSSVLGSLLVKDAMLQHMPHVALALLLLVEKFSPQSFWRPYVLALPSTYSTVLYFTTQELQELKGSPAFEPALKTCRNIARQYAYFSKLFQNTSDPASELLRDVFTYDEYRRAQDPLHPDCALDTEVEARAWAFLLARARLLLAAYPTTLQEDLSLLDGNSLSPCARLAVTLRASEKMLLEAARDYASPRVHP